MGATVEAVDQGVRFERVYREHGDRLWRGLVLYARDPEVASDALAEAFAQAIRRGDEILDPIAWITRAAYRIAAGELQRRRASDHLIQDPGYEMPEPAAELATALAALSPKQRAAAILHLRDGYTLAEVAQLIGSTPSAVGVHVHRARRRLRDLLGDDDA
jgi:RNA polymerase sigma-70 factor (ECF subfamily)